MNIKYKEGDLLGPYNILLIRRTYKEKNHSWHGDFKCPFCGKTFDARINEVVSGRRVSDRCEQSKEKQKNAVAETGRKNKKDLTGKHFGLLNVIKDTGKRKVSKHSSQVIWLCQCSCENKTIIEVPTGNLVSGNTTSCGCVGQSAGEKIIESILQKLKINFIKNKTFEDCINPDTKRHLHYDFYLPEYNICIEYDGIQHYKVTGWNTEDTLEKNKLWDKLKNQYCQNNNINLIRISYKEKNKINSDYIKRLIKESF